VKQEKSSVYRNDEVAARERREVLLAQIEQLEADAQRLSELPTQLTAARKELAQLERVIDRIDDWLPKRRWLWPLVGCAASVLLAGPGLAYYRHSRLLDQWSAEAQARVNQITRGAVAAYERESTGFRSERSPWPVHELCTSALPVPAAVPGAGSIVPSREMDQDFNTGNDTAGWKCLKFAVRGPLRFRLHYNQGSGFLGPARGGPDPGPDGFEVAAEGDRDGDGVTSLYTRVGKIDPKTSRPSVSKMFIDREFE